MLIDILIQYGFSEKEAQVYLTSLSLGSAPASSIARKMNENRVTVYSILKKFTSEGLAHSLTKKNTTFYHVVSPDDLLKNLELKYQKFKEKLPELHAMASLGGNKPKVQFFEGFEGLKLLYNDTLTSQVPGESFLGDENINIQLEEWLDNEYVPSRIEKGIHFRVIVANKQESKYYYKVTKNDLIEHRYVSGLSFGIHGEIMLYGPNKVAISMDHDAELAGLLIESKQFYDSMRNIFDFIRTHSHETRDSKSGSKQKQSEQPRKD